jgi:hypothetical protein
MMNGNKEKTTIDEEAKREGVRERWEKKMMDENCRNMRDKKLYMAVGDL